MSFTSIVLTLIVIVNGIFVIQFVLDLIKHKQELKREPKKDLLLAISSPIIFFFSSFGVSDFAISTMFYRKMKLIKDSVLPGTLNTQGSIPFAAMALFYISVIQVDKLTLVVCTLNNIGIGCFGPTMATVYALGMSPAVAFPIMMGSTALSVPIGSMQFIKYQKYDRKITLFTSTVGLLGVFLGVYFIHALDVSKLQWVVAFVLSYGGLNMIHQ